MSQASVMTFNGKKGGGNANVQQKKNSNSNAANDLKHVSKMAEQAAKATYLPPDFNEKDCEDLRIEDISDSDEDMTP